MGTYASYESSEELGSPAFIYKFVQGANEWFYSGTEQLTFEGNTYLAVPITHGSFGQGGGDNPGNVEIELPTATALGFLFQQGTPEGTVDVTIYEFHRGAGLAPIIRFLGEVQSGRFEGENGTLICAPWASLMDFQVPRGTMHKDMCTWITYDPLTCKVSASSFTFAGTVSAISTNGRVVTVPGATAFVPTVTGGAADPRMFWKGVLTKGGRRMMIVEQSGDDMILLERMPGLVVSDAVELLAGDDLSAQTCRDRFKNAGRRLAHPKMPSVSPWYTGLGAS